MKNDKPNIDNRYSRDPFRVPENYFEDLAKKMEQKIAAGEQTPAGREKQHHSFDLRRWVIAVSSTAAVVAGIVFGSYSIMHMQRGVEQQAEQITAYDPYDDIVEMLDIDQIEEILADYRDYE